MTGGRSYGSPGAFAGLSPTSSGISPPGAAGRFRSSSVQMAYDRLLGERLYLDDEGWIIKGATALLASDMGQRRPATGTVNLTALSHFRS